MKRAWLLVSRELAQSPWFRLPSEIVVLGAKPSADGRDFLWEVAHPGLPVPDDNTDLPLVSCVFEDVGEAAPKLIEWRLIEP